MESIHTKNEHEASCFLHRFSTYLPSLGQELVPLLPGSRGHVVWFAIVLESAPAQQSRVRVIRPATHILSIYTCQHVFFGHLIRRAVIEATLVGRAQRR